MRPAEVDRIAVVSTDEEQHTLRVPTVGRARPPATRTAVFSTSEVVSQGVIGLLPEDWRDRAMIVTDTLSLERAIGDPPGVAIVDADAPGASDAALAVSAHGGRMVMLVSSPAQAFAPWILEQADAILVRDEVDQLLLRMALAAARLGMRLVPRELPALASGPGGAARLDEQARKALAMLADGQRDAEIARELNLSESAVRKLVQRTVHGIGARTRCQAVALAARTGQLP